MGMFRRLIERIKNGLLVSAANQVEADMADRAIEQKAELHRKAKQYEAEGLHQLAGELREKANAIDLTKPTQSILPGAGYLIDDSGNLALTAAAPAETPKALPPAPTPEPEPVTKKSKKSAK